MSIIYTSIQKGRPKRMTRAPNVPSIGTTTIILVGDTHYGREWPADPYGSAIERQIAAINGIHAVPHPLGGNVGPVTAVLQLGDCVHEATEAPDRYFDDFRLDGTGRVHYPCYKIDGNHDQNPVRTRIVSEMGSLTWAYKIGRCWFQAMTETYTDENNNSPPDVTQIEGDVTDSVGANVKNNAPLFLVFHRALTGGYVAEWERTPVTTIVSDISSTQTIFGVADASGLSEGQYIQIDSEEIHIEGIVTNTLAVTRGTNKVAHTSGADVYSTDALDSLATLAGNYRTIGLLHGHDHYDYHTTWRGHRVISPGSIAQYPNEPPFSTVFPESIVVLRIGLASYDIASYVFGYGIKNNELVWQPGTWNWAETVTFA